MKEMPESLIGIFCTFPVSFEVCLPIYTLTHIFFLILRQTISSIIQKSYKKSAQLLSPPSLLVLFDTDKDTLNHYTTDSVSPLPIDSTPSPFIGWSTSDITRFLRSNATGTVINDSLFLLADETTATDGESLLLVQADYSRQELSLESVRLSAECVNSASVAVSIGSGDVRELQSTVHSDGVFRYGIPPVQGGTAPRKQL